ncbi:glycoside hydrolase family 3 N-terminal domain-containing protein [Bifidobacterium mongoliense]|uniref:glycoside hydrolase family 3 N-terminal domain-containing protein n=1 Tax=Bifidobacterium mongoliense TaxID=518643 RepID=UPI002647C743|nr:glycoside hydrolase family 3 N-terminal domain-containing protein [Bifidobacterium mongoliense]MDN5633741.1 glycoside hydrolase family 3 C-terminal domain-containing protein [Bifidobacterium mongoliense]
MHSTSQSPTPTYLNRHADIDNRVQDLLSRMTVEEKVGQLMQLDAQHDLASNIRDKHIGSILHTSPTNLIEAAALTRETRLRIPLLVGEDCIHGYSFWPGATIFPTQLTMAGSWDYDLVRQVARITAIEASATGIHWTFSPVLCIARDLRWGRVGETFGEDPMLIGELACAMVEGYQGSGLNDPTSILATAKHFAAYSETQGGRDASEADVSHRKMRSWFLPPFEKVARAGCRTFMLGYQTTDGIPITLNHWLLNDVLRNEWGYKGTLITDWDNVGRMIWEQHLQPDYTHAAAAAIRAGNDMIMTTPNFYEGALNAIHRGLITESDLDRPVRNVLRLKFELGLFEHPRTPDQARIAAAIGTREHTELNLRMARESLVLLRNDGTLPLNTQGSNVSTTAQSFSSVTHDTKPDQQKPIVAASVANQHTLALIGPLADNPKNQLGDWAGGSGQVSWIKEEPRETVVTIRDGLQEALPHNYSLTYAKGANILTLEADPAGATFPDGQPRPPIQTPCAPDPHMINEAADAAANAETTIVVVGDVIELVGEGRSTATLELFGAQTALLEAIAQTCHDNHHPWIVVLMASKPLVLPQCTSQAAAIIWAGNPGMQGGRALAELLLGKIEPQGRLPISFARHSGQLPIYYNQIRGQHGSRYADLTQEPAFSFGEGLSYTHVDYSNPCLSVEGRANDNIHGGRLQDVHMDDILRITVTLHNTGQRPCVETVQVYVRDVVTSVSWADKELKAFQRVPLEIGQEARVSINLPVSNCTIVNAEEKRVVEPGDFDVMVGHSSKPDDLLPVGFTVVAENR